MRFCGEFNLLFGVSFYLVPPRKVFNSDGVTIYWTTLSNAFNLGIKFVVGKNKFNQWNDYSPGVGYNYAS